jgi:hypothetical protein
MHVNIGERIMVETLIKFNPIVIVSGEGEVGTVETYNGKRTLRAIKMRLAKERRGGVRWSKAKVYSHENDYGPVWFDVETGEYLS